jgi:hypothetical protein
MSNDDETSPLLLPLPIEVMSVILCEVNKTDTIFELQSKHNIVEDTKSKKAYASYIDTDLDSYLNQYSRNDMEVTRRIASYDPYVRSNTWGFEDGDGLSMRDLLRGLTRTD